MTELLTYAKFYSEEQSLELTSFFTKHNINFSIEKDKEVLDKIYIGETLDPLINVKIKSDEFEKVNQLILSDFNVDISNVDEDYYLFSFSATELADVIDTRNNWNYFDRALAKKLLSEKQEVIQPSSIVDQSVSFKAERISILWLIAEYLLALVFSYAGIVIGLATLYAYKTQGNGKKLKMYDNWTRNHAIVILCIGVIRTLIFRLLPL